MTITSTLANTATLTSLDSTWVSIIDSTLNAEMEKKLNKLYTKSDEIDTREAIFTDLSNQISSFKSTLSSLWSTEDDYVGGTSRSTTIKDKSDTDLKIITASVDDDDETTSNAIIGSYDIAVTTLAAKNRVSSTTSFTSSSKAFGSTYVGSFTIGVDGESTEITVESDDTLYSLATKINSAKYEDGKGVTATVVDNKLVIESESSGSDYNMTLTDTAGSPLQKLGIIDSGGGFVKELQAGTDAVFTVNGIEVTRSSNDDINDVIDGVTFDLESDAEGNSATIEVNSDVSAMTSALNSFISQYNALYSYLTTKTSYSQVSDKEYSSGDLAGNSAVRLLRTEMITKIVSQNSNSGSIDFFSDLGITIKDGQMSISDAAKLSEALTNSGDDVQAFLDSKMEQFDGLLESYIGSDDSYITYTLTSLKAQKTKVENQITTETTRLSARQASLISYYESLDDTMDELLNEQTTLSAWLDTLSTLTLGSSS